MLYDIGCVAKWKGKSLQRPDRQFESDRILQNYKGGIIMLKRLWKRILEGFDRYPNKMNMKGR